MFIYIQGCQVPHTYAVGVVGCLYVYCVSVCRMRG